MELAKGHPHFQENQIPPRKGNKEPPGLDEQFFHRVFWFLLSSLIVCSHKVQVASIVS